MGHVERGHLVTRLVMRDLLVRFRGTSTPIWAWMSNQGQAEMLSVRRLGGFNWSDCSSWYIVWVHSPINNIEPIMWRFGFINTVRKKTAQMNFVLRAIAHLFDVFGVM